MEYIKKLKFGDTIGIFSPSSPITYLCPKRFNRAKKYLNDKGLGIPARSAYQKFGFVDYDLTVKMNGYPRSLMKRYPKN